MRLLSSVAATTQLCEGQEVCTRNSVVHVSLQFYTVCRDIGIIIHKHKDCIIITHLTRPPC
jgi:hypothetical protein